MAIADELARISEDMRKLVHDPDSEVAHRKADSLLVEALELLAGRGKSRRPHINRILNHFDEIEKWYA